MSAPHDRLDDRPRLARALVLERLLPPLLHRANNALAVVQGVLELGERARGEERELARRETRALTALLGHLGALARGPSAGQGPRDLHAIASSVEVLLRPLAEALGVDLEIRVGASVPTEGALPACVDARCEPLWIALVVERTVAVARAGGPGLRRARFRLRAASGWVALSLACDEPVARDGPLVERGALDELDELARQQGGRISIRARRRAWGCRLSLPLAILPSMAAAGMTAAVAIRPGPAGTRPRARVFLLQGEGELRELCATVLREDGHSVVDGSSLHGSGVFDLVLVDSELARGDPGLLARLSRDPQARGARLACLGRWPCEGEDPPTLEKPFRPHELLAFVDELAREPGAEPRASAPCTADILVPRGGATSAARDTVTRSGPDERDPDRPLVRR